MNSDQMNIRKFFIVNGLNRIMIFVCSILILKTFKYFILQALHEIPF